MESTIIAFWPPVSAISAAIGPAFSASWRLMIRAVSVEPVKHTPATRASRQNTPPRVAPSPGRKAITSAGRPASNISSRARAAIRLVCSAGLASTQLPDTRAAAI
ncbi:hypothetical protein D3C86_1515620 [compost metagenome]